MKNDVVKTEEETKRKPGKPVKVQINQNWLQSIVLNTWALKANGTVCVGGPMHPSLSGPGQAALLSFFIRTMRVTVATYITRLA